MVILLVKVVRNGLHIFAPASATGVALAVLPGRRALVPDRRFCCMDVGFLHARDWLDRHVWESRGHSDDKIVRYVRVRQKLAHEAALASR
jgi:hypothetical protein